jgi:GT2 family glycosyltransferase
MVSVLITTFNSAQFIGPCLDSLRRQTYKPLEIIIVDNSSTDQTRALLEPLGTDFTVILNEINVGFAAAQNQTARIAKGTWLLSLNPDVVLETDFIARLVAAGETDPTFGSVCGKLLRWNPGQEPEFSQTIDSTGIYFTPNLRHLDRGAGDADQGQYEQSELVFGATGAAALYRRSMWEDISVEGQFFDEQFFAYREDADLAWRAQLMGWKCLYVPKARGWHVRRVTPERRAALPLAINFHSIKNRFRMRVKNIAGPLYRRLWFPVTIRDAQVLGYCLLVAPKLLPALAQVWKSRGELRRQRRIIQSRRRVSDLELARWFAFRPVSIPITLPTPNNEVTSAASKP